MNFIHFYQIPFTGLGKFSGYRGDAWLKNRLKVFKEYVLPSLIAQGSRDFYLWFQFRPEEKTNPIVKEFQEFMDGVRDVFSVFTFGGITFWDDKYSDEIASERLMKSLEVSLPELKSYVGDLPVLLTIQPSDDMYLMDTAKKLQAKFRELLEKDPSTNKVVGYKKGYIMNIATKEIAEYLDNDKDRTPGIVKAYPDTTPPFFTILFSNEEFMNPQKHYEHIGPYKSHEKIVDVLDYTTLEGRGFIVGCHGMNISTMYNHPFKGRVLPKEEANGIMVEAGILFSNPIVFKKSGRNRIRSFINKLPFLGLLKIIYSRLPRKLKII